MKRGRRALSRRAGPFIEIGRALWHNRDRPGYALRILRNGVCDGCALGTSGLSDWTIPGIHLCWIRLNLLRVNTVPPFDPARLTRVDELAGRSEQELRALGRIPSPLVRRRGEPGFTPLGWEEATRLAADRIRSAGPERIAFYVVSRGTVNETYYVAQKAARLIGTNDVDNSARICHAPSTTGLKRSIGFAASTCSYSDLIGSDLVVFVGSDAANNQPVTMKYLHLAKKAGTRIAMINPVREPGMEKYWVPSTAESALFGTDICDEFFEVRVGGDVGFLNGVLKQMIADGSIDDRFVSDRTSGFDELARHLERTPWDELESSAGAPRSSMKHFAKMYGATRSAVFVWSMGVTMHVNGVDNVRAIANLALARGNVGRPKTGLMPIRGHSGVQGGAEMGCVPNQLPGGVPLDAVERKRFEELWGFPLPERDGRFIGQTMEAAHAGEIDVLYAAGGNLVGVLPDPSYSTAALERVGLRIHHDIVLNPQMLVEPGDTVLILPATTRYEMAGGNTETSTERRVIFNPEIEGPRVEEARDEWRFLSDLAAAVRPELAEKISYRSTSEIREEIARAVPAYTGIERLSRRGDQFQWGGPLLAHDLQFGTPDGRARFAAIDAPFDDRPDGAFRLTTRRGKQFNSMVFGDGDMLMGATRDEVLVCREDLDRLGLEEGDRVTVRSETGSFEARIATSEVAPGTAVAYWPEANAAIARGDYDPDCGMPPYRNAVVRIEPIA